MLCEGHRIGVLALQGGFAKHVEKVGGIELRYPQELDTCDGLIIPGGESTVIYKQAETMGWIEPLRTFAKTKPIFGTCAGAILMARLGIIDMQVLRNGYGRQIASCSTHVLFKPLQKEIPAIFIRAPIITHVGEQVEVLAYYNEHPVLICQGRHLAATFHPELTDDPTVHDFYTAALVREATSSSSLNR